MRLVNIQHESTSIGDCVNNIVKKSTEVLSRYDGYIYSSKIELTFGAFMHLSVTLLLRSDPKMGMRVLADYSPGKNKEAAVSSVLDSINSKLPNNAEVIDFALGTYTTPVTRRTYAVAVVVYNVPITYPPLNQFNLKERRELLARVLELFDYNPKVLNISEVARTFGVSRDSIYYDIEQILKERKKNGSTL